MNIGSTVRRINAGDDSPIMTITKMVDDFVTAEHVADGETVANRYHVSHLEEVQVSLPEETAEAAAENP